MISPMRRGVATDRDATTFERFFRSGVALFLAAAAPGFRELHGRLIGRLGAE